jgi:hypothetical protein
MNFLSAEQISRAKLDLSVLKESKQREQEQEFVEDLENITAERDKNNGLSGWTNFCLASLPFC